MVENLQIEYDGIFGQLLKRYRKENSLTQEQLADQAGITHSYISKIETGVYNPPTREKVLLIADALGISDKEKRNSLLLAASCLGLKDIADTNEIDHLGSLLSPQKQLLRDISELLNDPTLSLEQQNQYYNLIDSFVSLLKSSAKNK